MANENGIVVTQAGIPVERSADYQRVLDSRWRFMEMVVDIEIDVSHSDWKTGYQIITLYEHKLGFLPAFEFYQDESVQMNPDVFFGGAAYNYIMSDTNKVFLEVLYTDYSTIPVRIKGQLRIFNVPITEEYTAPDYGVNLGSGITDTSIGVRAIETERRGTARMGDETMTAYSLNTKAKTLSVHKTGFIQATDHTVTITHNVGYPPTYYVCRVQDLASGFYTHPLNGVRVVMCMTNQFSRAVANSRTIIFKGVQSTLLGVKLGYLILKDPVELAE